MERKEFLGKLGIALASPLLLLALNLGSRGSAIHVFLKYVELNYVIVIVFFVTEEIIL